MNMKNQSQKKVPLKIYPKVYEDICDLKKLKRARAHLGCAKGSLDELILRFKTFYKEAHPLYFGLIVKEIWLSQQLTYNNLQKATIYDRGFRVEQAYSYFRKMIVGVSQRVFTNNFSFAPVATYFIDLFPEFSFHDPFESPEKYEYPYKHVTLDFLVFVYQMENRLEILEEAERRTMSYGDFTNWVTNWIFCHNDEIGRDKYNLAGGHYQWVYVKNNDIKKPRMWRESKFNFNVKK